MKYCLEILEHFIIYRFISLKYNCSEKHDVQSYIPKLILYFNLKEVETNISWRWNHYL